MICPFCNQKSAKLFYDDVEGLWNRVVCSNWSCEARGPIRQSPDEARKAWETVCPKPQS